MATRPQASIDRIRAANGNAYDPTNNPGGLAQGGHRQNFVPDLNAAVDVADYVVDLANEASTSATNAVNSASGAASSATNAASSATDAANSAARFQGTSASNSTPGLGTKTFTTQANKAFTVGTFLLIQSRGTPTRWMFGKVTAYNTSTGALTVSVEAIGAATAAGTDWDILVAGARGAVGADSWAAPVAWTASTTYTAVSPRSVVVYDGETYVAAVTHTAGTTFEPSVWTKIAAKGTQLTKATGANVRSLTEDTAYVTAKAMADAMAFVTGNATGTFAPDFSTGFNFAVGMVGNVTLGQPTNMKDGLPVVFYFQQDATGGRTIAFNATYHKFPGGIVPTLSTASGAIDRLTGICRNRSGTMVVEWGSLDRDIK